LKKLLLEENAILHTDQGDQFTNKNNIKKWLILDSHSQCLAGITAEVQKFT